MKKVCLTVGMALLFVLIFSQKGLAEDQIFEREFVRVGRKYVPGEIIVKFKRGVRESDIATSNSRHGTSVFYTSRFAGFKRLRIPRRKKVSEMLEIYRKDPNVEYAELNYIAYAFWFPNDPYYFYQWHLDNPEYGGIQMEDAWGFLIEQGLEPGGSPDVIIAVVDTGVAYEDYSRRRKRYYLAPDLAVTNFVPGYDFVENESHANDDNGHGTHVTGTIAQSTDNDEGVAGVAFNCSIMPVKVLNRYGSGTYADVADGIIFAADNGAHVINLSLGGSSPSTTLENACAYAYQNGVTIVCAAGNDGEETVSYPAAYDDYCIAVGATRYDETLSYYSNYGNSLDLVAPGGDLNIDQNEDEYSDGILQQTFSGNTQNFGYWFYQGTSMAAPHVSGVVALLISSGAAITPDEVRSALQETAEDLGDPGRDDIYGWGLIDACAALQWSAGPVDNPPTVSITEPADGAIIAGTTNITADASDDNDVLQVEFFVNDSSIGVDLDGSDGWLIVWDSTSIDDGTHIIKATATDNAFQTAGDSVSVTVDNINELPVADAGPDQSVLVGETVNFDGSNSNDPDGDIVSYDWDFGDGNTGTGVSATHTYSTADTYTVTLTVTDNGGLTDTDTLTVIVSEEPSEITVFSDSFESSSDWTANWSQDTQNDWRRRTARKKEGSYAAEVDGRANDAQLISIPINLQGKTDATITFWWYIERGLDTGEYLAFDVSVDGGANWVEKARLSGNVDAENTWHNVSIGLSGINSLRIRFRGKMSSSNEDAYVDVVEVIAAE